MEETNPTPLQIPEIALIIISHLDPTNVLSIRLVSFGINTLVLTHQRSINRSIAQRLFSTDIDWHAPEIDHLQKNFYLNTLSRLPKAYTLARRANKNLECYAEAGRAKIPGRRNAEGSVLKPTSLYPAFLGRCARTILILWTLNDIRQFFDESEPLPSYVSPPPPPSRQGWLGRLFSRLTISTSKPDPASPSPVDTNAHILSLYVSTLKPRSKVEFSKYSSTLAAARQTYLNSLSRNQCIDLIWVQDYLFLGMPRNTSRHSTSRHGTSEDIVFALHQSPGFILSLCSDDERERLWAQMLARAVVRARESELSLDEWERISPFSPGEAGLEEEVRRAKGELTRGDWRDRGEAV